MGEGEAQARQRIIEVGTARTAMNRKTPVKIMLTQK